MKVFIWKLQDSNNKLMINLKKLLKMSFPRPSCHIWMREIFSFFTKLYVLRGPSRKTFLSLSLFFLLYEVYYMDKLDCQTFQRWIWLSWHFLVGLNAKTQRSKCSMSVRGIFMCIKCDVKINKNWVEMTWDLYKECCRFFDGIRWRRSWCENLRYF